MGFISDIFGGNSSGQGFKATNPFSSEQQQQAIKSTQDAMAQQNAFVQQLQAQGGLQNQSNVFGQMQGTAQQLQDASQGLGPNPAQAQLAQATAANTANQAALMAGQRGASSNAGLMARQAAMQGGANQQNAAGQAATMGAQQQIAARQQLQQQQAMMGQMAGQQAGQMQQGLAQYGNMAQGNQQQMLGAQANVNTTNAQIAQGNAQRQGGALSGLMGAAGAALAGPLGSMAGGLFGGGGGVKKIADPTGGDWYASHAGPDMNQKMAAGGMVDHNAPSASADASRIDTGWGKVIRRADGGMIDSNDANGPRSHHGKFLKMQNGGQVPGQAAVAGDSYANDTKHVLLSPNEIVIPRSITMSNNAPEKAAAFVAAILAKNGAPK
jgi:hypothetical protein